jgi:hypothetical protein
MEAVQGDRAQRGEGGGLEIDRIGQGREQGAGDDVVLGMDRVITARADRP